MRLCLIKFIKAEKSKNMNSDDDYQKKRILLSDFSFLHFLCYNLRKTITLQWDSEANDQLERLERKKAIVERVFSAHHGFNSFSEKIENRSEKDRERKSWERFLWKFESE